MPISTASLAVYSSSVLSFPLTWLWKRSIERWVRELCSGSFSNGLPRRVRWFWGPENEATDGGIPLGIDREEARSLVRPAVLSLLSSGAVEALTEPEVAN